MTICHHCAQANNAEALECRKCGAPLYDEKPKSHGIKEIVVNRCYGGFGLSVKGSKYYLSLIGKEGFAYYQTKYKFESGVNEYTRLSDDHPRNKDLFTNVSTKDLGPTIDEIPDDCFFSYCDIERTDPNLIKTVRDLGAEASGQCAELEIVEIPDGTDYVIEEYDGYETVEECHQSW